MIYGPRAMTHASRLLIHGPRFNKLSIIFFSLELGAWRLRLGACSFWLEALETLVAATAFAASARFFEPPLMGWSRGRRRQRPRGAAHRCAFLRIFSYPMISQS